MKLSAVDLNLLVAFDALLSEGSVSEAARRIGLSQPAMSKRLARLRSLFRDDLFLRSGDGVRPTERALDLADSIRSALRQIEDAFGGYSRFDAVRSTRIFRIATTDNVTATLLPGVMGMLRAQAPRMALVVRALDRREVVNGLERGEIDLALTLIPDAPATIKRAALFPERYVSLVSARHPEIKRKLTLDMFLKYPHVLITHVGDLKGAIDRLLDERGLKRQVALSVPYHLAVPELIAETDMIATLSERIVRSFAWQGVRSFTPPVDYPEFRQTLLWHRRNDNDPAHVWLRNVIFTANDGLQGAEAKHTRS
ncbi:MULTISPECIES: LysR family transcriptional regulator [Bradyrhizobium]|uniref:LysR family transcriptional regulator n=1 Tax=Bradyrhizobium elkanii TaxID=29448 RepID=UPI000550D8D4|nr:LysR family transcriptional regulator [Bradyrhizobium elkanii]